MLFDKIYENKKYKQTTKHIPSVHMCFALKLSTINVPGINILREYSNPNILEQLQVSQALADGCLRVITELVLHHDAVQICNTVHYLMFTIYEYNHNRLGARLNEINPLCSLFGKYRAF